MKLMLEHLERRYKEDVDEDIWDLCDRMKAKDPASRPSLPVVADVLADLQDLAY